MANKMRGSALLFTLFVVSVFAAPVVLLVIQSFAGQWSWPWLLPETWNLHALNYVRSQAAPLLRSLGSTTLYSLATVLLSLCLSLLPASALARGDLPRRALVYALLSIPIMVPPVTFSLGIHHVFLHLGLVDKWFGVVLILTAFAYPYMLRALVGGYQATKGSYIAAAANLGAGRIRRIVEVELPLLAPAVIAGGTVVFLVAFSDYYLVFLIGGGVLPNYSGYLFPFLGSSEQSVAALLCLVFLITPLILFGVVEVTVGRWYRKRGMG